MGTACARESSLAAQASNSDRKSTRLNSSHRCISYAVFCLILRPSTSTLFPYTTLFRSAMISLGSDLRSRIVHGPGPSMLFLGLGLSWGILRNLHRGGLRGLYGHGLCP